MDNLLSAKLITYNRAERLSEFLETWNASDLSQIPLEILDNASTDGTADVIAEACKNNPSITRLRHNLNIGAVGNLLRAYERFESKYCWVICDDDILDKSCVPELFDALAHGPDALLVGSPGVRPMDSGFKGNTSIYGATGAHFCYAASFLPGLIFDRKFLSQGVLFRCYKAASTLYPHCALIEAIITADSTLTVLTKPLINRVSGRDVSGIAVNWLMESILPCKYMSRGSKTWASEFLVCAGFGDINKLTRATLYWRIVGLYGLHDFTFLVRWSGLSFFSLLAVFVTSICPKWSINLVRWMLGKKRPANYVYLSERY